MSIEIIVPVSEEQWTECRLLHYEYVTQIGSHPVLRTYFTTKAFFAEINQMPTGYEPPEGICLLAYYNGVAVGTVALRRLDQSLCEMKRLYVKPQARGTGLGKKLVEELIVQGKKLGYSRMRLDNSRSAMAKANALYSALGFYEIERYNDNSVSDAYFMERIL